jgi:RNA polymerase sigma-70 factor (ECF subfamily)
MANRDSGDEVVAECGPTIDWQQELSRHDRWLRTVVAARLRDRLAVDEVMQEVSLAALEQRAPLRNAASVAPWLYRLAVLQSLLYRRKRGRARKLASRFAERAEARQHDDCGRADPLDWLVANERHALVRQAVSRLSDRDAEILMLKYGEDWSYHELAAHLGISHSAVETRLHRARRRLRDELAALNVVETMR